MLICTFFSFLLLIRAQPYIVEIDSTYERYMKSGVSERYEFKRIKVLSDGATQSLKSVVTSYTPYYNSARFDFVRIIRKGKIINIDTLNYTDVLAPPELGGTIFWGTRNKIVDLPDLKKGDIVEYQVYKLGGNWLGPAGETTYKTPYPGYFNVIELFGSDVQIKKKVYVLEELPDKPVQFKVFNGGNIKVHKTLISGRTVYKFEARNIKGLDFEPFSPSKYDLLPKLIVTNLPSWKTMSMMEFKRAESNIEPDSLIKAVSDSLCSGLSDEEKVKKLFYFVADEIRYLGLIESENEGYEPHRASLTLIKRSGVCKDKAALLASLLRAQGFRAYYATTAVGMRIENIPSDQTNHAIVALEVSPFEYVYLDPTVGSGGRDLLPPSEWGQGVLVSREEGDTLREIPSLGKEHNLLSVHLVDSLIGDTLKFLMVLKAKGAWDQNFRGYARKGSAYFRRHLQGVLSSLFGKDAEIEDLSFTEVYDYTDYFKVRVKGRVLHALSGSNEIRLFKPAISSAPETFIWYLKFLNIPRKTPFVFRYPFQFYFEESVYSPYKSICERIAYGHTKNNYEIFLGTERLSDSFKLSMKLGFDKKVYTSAEINDFVKSYDQLKRYKNLWLLLRQE
ncbi:MAG: DUF3857 domain-containing protein [candidate division WOR-3 bacterium]